MKMKTIKKTRHLVSALGCGAALTMSCVWADQVPGSQTEDPSRRPPQPMKPAPNHLVTVEAGEPAPAMADSGARIAVSQFRFTGNHSQSSDKLAPLVASYLGKTLTLAELNNAANAIKSHYRANGWFLAQAYIPAQAPANGVVEIAVLEGRIDTLTVNVAEDAPIRADYANRLVSTFLQSGQTITEVGLEGPLLLLRDLPRIDAKSVINPGSVPGTANIVVNLVKDPDVPLINGRLEVDNFGGKVSGATRLGAEVNVNNPFGLGDSLSLRGYAANQSGNTFGRIGYTLPVGARGARVGVNFARLDYVLGNLFEALKPNGVANVFSANVSYPLLRSRNGNLVAQLVVERKDLEDRTTLPFSSDKHTLTSGRFQLSGDMRDSMAGVTVYSASVTGGKLHEEDPFKVAIDELTYQTEGSFVKFLYSLQRLQQFAPGLHGMFSVSGQHTNKNLTAAEKFSIGGDGTVRAYPVGYLVGDQGYTGTAELRWSPAALTIGQLEMAAILFYDFGHIVRNHDNTQVLADNNKSSISGYGVGLNLGYGPRFLVKVSVAWQQQGKDTIAGFNRGPRALAQASYAF
jgi:hemolysin activation/secretion protein